MKKKLYYDKGINGDFFGGMGYMELISDLVIGEGYFRFCVFEISKKAIHVCLRLRHVHGLCTVRPIIVRETLVPSHKTHFSFTLDAVLTPQHSSTP